MLKTYLIYRIANACIDMWFDQFKENFSIQTLDISDYVVGDHFKLRLLIGDRVVYLYKCEMVHRDGDVARIISTDFDTDILIVVKNTDILSISGEIMDFL